MKKYPGLIYWLLMAVTAIIVAASVFLIPRVRINSDVTTYLPEDSPMRQGLNIVAEHLPALDIRRQTIRMVFSGETPSDSLTAAVEALLDDPQMPDIREGNGSAYYQYSLPRDTDGEQVKKTVRERFGKKVRVEIEDNTGMPDHLPRMIGTGFILMLLILIMMSPSLMEALLFMGTIGIAILINIGTNAFLPSVSMITNALSSVLQMALSLDYAIILSNRLRQVKGKQSDIAAMGEALRRAAPSILGSAFTTIASLLMLCFMRLRFGQDFGVVLSKGVLCSLICTFTLLPGLLLLFRKPIAATSKRVPLPPTDRLARFEYRFRIPITLAFVALFAGSYFLQRRVPVSYSMMRKTSMMKTFPPQNMILLVYPTAEEEALLPIADSLPDGMTCLSYPTIALEPHTAAEWRALYPDMLGGVPAEAMDLLFYAATHPERNERFALNELQIPPEYGKPFTLPSLLPSDPPKPKAPAPAPKPAAPDPVVPDTTAVTPGDTVAVIPSDTSSVIPSDSGISPVDTPVNPGAGEQRLPYTWDGLHQKRTIAEMNQYLGVDASYLRIIYRMAGSGKQAMSALEVMDVVQKKILGNKTYAAMVPKDKRAELQQMKRDFDAVLAAGPPPVVEPPVIPSDTTAVIPSDTTAVIPVASEGISSSDSTRLGQVDKPVAPVDTPVTPSLSKQIPSSVPTPKERLAIAALTGEKCSVTRCYDLLRSGGIKVTREEVEMLYLYNGFKTSADTTVRLSLNEMLSSLDSLSNHPMADQFVDADKRAQLSSLREQMDTQLGLLRSEEWSAAVLLSYLPEEGPETYEFLSRMRTQCDDAFNGEAHLAGYSIMYDEMRGSFPRELLLVTLLTALVILLIVALTFRRILIPVILVSIVLTAVWLDVFVSGLGGHAILFMAYFIVQSILMGATIDYSILFAHYYRDSRQTADRQEALKAAYRGSIHTIMTSGMIIVLGTGIMMLVVSDPVIVPVLKSISGGSLIAIILILFVLPALLSFTDFRKK